MRASPESLRRNLAINLRQKMRFPRWREERHRIDNWLALYLLTSSLVVQVASRVFRNADWIRRRDLVVRHSDGLTFHFPMWRYLRDPESMLELDRTYTSYLSRFERMLGRKLSFEPGDVVIDVGAHVGTFTIPLLAHHPGLRVIAVEPDPANMTCLARGLAANGVEPRRYALEQAALCGEATSELSFAVGDVATRGTLAGLGFFREGKHHAHIAVRGSTLETLFSTHGITNCKLLKIDCEGCEYQVLRSLPTHILDRIENMILEVHPVAGEDPGTFAPWLTERGFRVVVDEQTNGCLEVFCSRSVAA